MGRVGYTSVSWYKTTWALVTGRGRRLTLSVIPLSSPVSTNAISISLAGGSAGAIGRFTLSIVLWDGL